MNEDFAPFELAVKLREKGFNWRIGYAYGNNGEYMYAVTEYDVDYIPAPTIYQVLKWLRKEKCLHIEILHIFSEETLWDFEVVRIGSYERWWSNLGLFDTYEQSAIAGIEYVLDKLI